MIDTLAWLVIGVLIGILVSSIVFSAVLSALSRRVDGHSQTLNQHQEQLSRLLQQTDTLVALLHSIDIRLGRVDDHVSELRMWREARSTHQRGGTRLGDGTVIHGPVAGRDIGRKKGGDADAE